MFENKILENSLINILTTFTESDGGTAFFKFKTFLEVVDKQSQKDNIRADRAIEIVKNFSDLIDVVQDLEFTFDKVI